MGIGLVTAAPSPVTHLVSGTTAIDRRGRVVAPNDAAAQTRRIFEIITSALTQTGGSLEDVVRTRMFVTDIASDADAIGEVHGEILVRFGPQRRW